MNVFLPVSRDIIELQPGLIRWGHVVVNVNVATHHEQERGDERAEDGEQNNHVPNPSQCSILLLVVLHVENVFDDRQPAVNVLQFLLDFPKQATVTHMVELLLDGRNDQAHAFT
jgi:hypothetical protein